MRSKPLYRQKTGFFASLCLLVAGVFATEVSAILADDESRVSRYLGSLSCASSSCHGGAGEKRDQWVQWNTRDVHRRANSTLSLARSAQIATAAGIADPANHARCLDCHAPNAAVPESGRLAALDRTEGVSCEACHAPSETWIRTHTRTAKEGFSYANKLAAGLRDLQNVYVRANTCVACHQHVDRDLIQAGHPELIFELDGQSASEPRHWTEPAGASGARAWWVGQAVALREIAWHQAQGAAGAADDRNPARLQALRWLLELTETAVFPGASVIQAAAPDAAAVQTAADQRAREAAGLAWNPGITAALLHRLAGSAPTFRATGVPTPVLARRAERLVLGLDRVLAASDPKLEARVDAELKELFRLAQSLPGFDPAAFAAALERLEKKL
jgi:hypothetical protein